MRALTVLLACTLAGFGRPAVADDAADFSARLLEQGIHARLLRAGEYPLRELARELGARL